MPHGYREKGKVLKVKKANLCSRCSFSKLRRQVSHRPRSLREEAPMLSAPFSILNSNLISPTILAFDGSTVYAHDFDEITKMHGGKALKSKSDWPGALMNRVENCPSSGIVWQTMKILVSSFLTSLKSPWSGAAAIATRSIKLTIRLVICILSGVPSRGIWRKECRTI